MSGRDEEGREGKVSGYGGRCACLFEDAMRWLLPGECIARNVSGVGLQKQRAQGRL